MAETCDVMVTAGTANVGSPWTVPELRQTMDFTRAPEFTLLGVGHERIHELRALGFEVQVTKGKDPAPSPTPKAKRGKAEEPTTDRAAGKAGSK